MPAPRKYDQETRERAARLYEERRRDVSAESASAARRHVGELRGINPETLRHWIERREVDSGTRSGVPSELAEEVKALRRENAELKRANEILKTASAFFAAAELDRQLR